MPNHRKLNQPPRYLDGRDNSEYERWRYQNIQSERERKLRNRRKYSQKIKLEVLSHYSGGVPKCALCSCFNLDALTLDHVKGGGNAHRKSIGATRRHRKGRVSGIDFYNWIRQNNYPEGYRILCMNHQFIERARMLYHG